MSVWLPVRPSYVVIHTARSLVLRRQLSVLLPSSHLLLRRAHQLPRQVTVSRRWQSTKGTASSDADVPVTADGKGGAVAAKDESAKGLSTRIWSKVKHEAAHYWHGTKLLVSEVRISARLQWKILHGETLTRRERRQVFVT